jgi:hypothetical protein
MAAGWSSSSRTAPPWCRTWLSSSQGHGPQASGAAERHRGGQGADFFDDQADDCRSQWRDTITDFRGGRGDRLGLNAILDGTNPFANPGWTFIDAQRFTATGQAELRFTRAGWLLGVTTFNTDWIS